MKILCLLASPRKIGNSEICVKEIAKELPADWEKEIINLCHLHIEPCKACYSCLPAGKKCIIKDDLELFLTKLQTADKVVIAGPVYFLGAQTAIKLITDRLLCILNEGDKFYKDKPCVIALTHGVKNWEGYGREAMLNFAHFLGLKVLGLRRINKHLPGDAAQPDSLVKLHALAQALMANTILPEENQNTLFCPECSSSLLRITKDGTWHCTMCGASGTLENTGSTLALSPAQSHVPRYSKEGIAEHGKLLLSINKEFHERRREVFAALHKYL